MIYGHNTPICSQFNMLKMFPQFTISKRRWPLSFSIQIAISETFYVWHSRHILEHLVNELWHECLRLKGDPWPLLAKNRAHPWAQEEIPDTCTEIPLRRCHRKFQHQSKQAANRKNVKTAISVSKQKKIIHRTGSNSTLCHYCFQLVNMI